MTPIIIAIGAILTLLTPSVAHAQLSGVIGAVGNGLVMRFGGTGPEAIAATIINIVGMILYPIASFMIVKAGFTLVGSQDEDKLGKAKQTIGATVVGIMLVYVSQQVVASFFVKRAVQDGLEIGRSAILILELTGIMNWVTTLMAVLGIVIIIVSGLRVISSFGKEEGMQKMRETILGVATGLILVLIVPAIKLTLGVTDNVIAGSGQSPDAGSILAVAATIAGNVMLFLALIAVSVVIYAGVMMVIGAGNEDQYSKSRSLILRSLGGLIVILISYGLALFVVSLVTG